MQPARHQIGKKWAPVLALLTIASVTSIAQANVQACVDAHSNGQVRKDESDFLAARGLFSVCSSTDCPEPIRVECTGLLARLDEQMPTVVISVEDASGADVPNASVEVDGKAFLDELTGRVSPINPGRHTFQFRHPDGRTTETTVLILEGAKGRPIVGRFAPATSPPTPISETSVATTPPASDRSPASNDGSARRTLAYVLAGAGAVGLATFGYFALSGRSRQSELEDSCKPNCTKEQARSVSTKYLVADISLALGVGLIGAGTVVWFSAPISPRVGTSAPTVGYACAF